MTILRDADPFVNSDCGLDFAESFIPSAEDLAELGRWHAAHDDPGHATEPTPLDALEAPAENPRDAWPAWTGADRWTLTDDARQAAWDLSHAGGGSGLGSIRLDAEEEARLYGWAR